jgi:hypothetical protein
MLIDIQDATRDLLEAAVHARRDRLLRPFEAVARKAWARVFKRQGSLLLAAMPKYSRYFTEAKKPVPPIDKDWDRIADETASEAEKALVTLSERTLLAGGNVLASSLNLDLQIKLDNPRAIAYLKEHGADLVTKINETTRERLRALLVKAIEEHLTYTEVAKEIVKEFNGFSSVRADMIAVTESAFGYEKGQRFMAADLQAAGIALEKSWLAESDACDICEENAGQDWIPEDEDFSSGDDGPPQHPACRCTSLTRRAETEEMAA